MKKVSVVVVNYNGEKHLDDCLFSLQSQDYNPLEIIVVDNNSSDRSIEIIKKYEDVRLIKLEENVGLAEGCNIGARESDGEFLCFVNNDMRFEEEFISELAKELCAEEDIFGVDALHYNWAGDKILHAGSVFRKVPFFKGHIPGFYLDPVAIIDKKIDVPWACLANLMVRRDRFFELDGFDKTLFIDFEDADLCWRAWLRGWRTVYVPSAKAYHKVGMSGETKSISEKRLFHQQKNFIRFVLKSMDGDIIVKMIFSLPVKAIGYTLKGRFKFLKAMVKAFFRVFSDFSEIMKERGNIKVNKKMSNKVLFQKFLISEEN